ncbi:PH domain-containing protein [Candidatus Kaiserbacteria bacterium]|nr:PH domain-containing protein [Candidatus Kaiserbacteria bacterium]
MLFEKIQLEDDEKVLTTARKHWFVIVSELFATFLLILLPFALLFILLLNPTFLSVFGLHAELHKEVIAFIIGAWLLLALLSAFRIWTHYYLDLWIITDRRIISVDQIGFFNRNVSMFRLERMQDIEYTMKGLLPTLLKFGTISAHTAGNNEDVFHATHMPNPQQLQGTIQKAMDDRIRVLHINPDSVT